MLVKTSLAAFHKWLAKNADKYIYFAHRNVWEAKLDGQTQPATTIDWDELLKIYEEERDRTDFVKELKTLMTRPDDVNTQLIELQHKLRLAAYRGERFINVDPNFVNSIVARDFLDWNEIDCQITNGYAHVSW